MQSCRTNGMALSFCVFTLSIVHRNTETVVRYAGTVEKVEKVSVAPAIGGTVSGA